MVLVESSGEVDLAESSEEDEHAEAAPSLAASSSSPSSAGRPLEIECDVEPEGAGDSDACIDIACDSPDRRERWVVGTAAPWIRRATSLADQAIVPFD